MSAIKKIKFFIEIKWIDFGSTERCWNMWIPGFGGEEVRPFKKLATTEAHKQVRENRKALVQDFLESSCQLLTL